ncbi:MAG: hypothetical protein ACREP7_13285, partial [Lysobacter sp.]
MRIRSATTGRIVLLMASALALSACAVPWFKSKHAAPAASADMRVAADLLERLRPLCGKAYAGHVVVDTPRSADDPFGGKSLVMHVRQCGRDEIRIAFQVGDDRSRTWV